MDDIVKQAMAKWPNVPAVYGWLGLNRRGDWLIKGERISNPVIIDFINRNYEHDTEGLWYFQNGPQRVYVALDYTPLVYRLAWSSDHQSPPLIESHTGKSVARVDSVWIDEGGIVLLCAEQGLGMVDDRDLDRLLPCFRDGTGAVVSEDVITTAIERLQAGEKPGLYFRYGEYIVQVAPIKARRVALKFGFVAQPVPRAGEEECI